MPLVRLRSAMEAKNRNERSPRRNRTSMSPERRSTVATQPGTTFTSRTTTIGPWSTITTVPAPATGITVGCTGGGSVIVAGVVGVVAGGGGLVLVVVGASVVVVVETSTSKAAVRIRRLPPTMSSERSTLRPGDSKLISTQSGARVLVEAVQPAAGDMALTSRRVDVRFTVAEPASSA